MLHHQIIASSFTGELENTHQNTLLLACSNSISEEYDLDISRKICSEENHGNDGKFIFIDLTSEIISICGISLFLLTETAIEILSSEI